MLWQLFSGSTNAPCDLPQPGLNFSSFAQKLLWASAEADFSFVTFGCGFTFSQDGATSFPAQQKAFFMTPWGQFSSPVSDLMEYGINEVHVTFTRGLLPWRAIWLYAEKSLQMHAKSRRYSALNNAASSYPFEWHYWSRYVSGNAKSFWVVHRGIAYRRPKSPHGD